MKRKVASKGASAVSDASDTCFTRRLNIRNLYQSSIISGGEPRFPDAAAAAAATAGKVSRSGYVVIRLSRESEVGRSGRLI